MFFAWPEPSGRRRLFSGAASAGRAAAERLRPKAHIRPDLDRGHHWAVGAAIAGILAAGVIYVAYSIYLDVDASGSAVPALAPFLAIFAALAIALSFEFINGFH
ncbi:MAG TPA: hypothetical protein VEH77_09605, partial [Roseiarcus sp.]|nr:hypothetical protein [Roseiarcus sp.]